MRDRDTSAYRRIGIALSVVAILAGLVMIGATFAGGGPSPLVGMLCGVLLIAYGVFRLYWTIKR